MAGFDREAIEQGRRHVARRDPALRPVIRRVGRCALASRGDPYRALVRSIVYQQLAGSAAGAIHGRLRSRFGGRIPRPEVLFTATEAQLRSDGLSRQKIAAVRAVATAFSDGSLDGRRLRGMEDQAVVAAVTEVRGIGEWTAHMLLMFSLGRLDVLPLGDLGIRKGAQRVYGLAELPKPVDLEARAEHWRPYRTIGSWYLWRATELE